MIMKWTNLRDVPSGIEERLAQRWSRGHVPSERARRETQRGQGTAAAHTVSYPSYPPALLPGLPLSSQAVEHFAVAAHLRDPDGLYNLGMCHLRGQGVKHNADKALQLLTLAKDSRHLGAAYQVAKMHHYGRGAPKNDVHVSGRAEECERGKRWGGWRVHLSSDSFSCTFHAPSSQDASSLREISIKE